jgi:hypothetical protein
VKKDYKSGKLEFTVEGSESLHNVIEQLIQQTTELQTRIDSQPNLAEQLKFWDKAKLFMGDDDVDFNQNPLEVQKKILGDQGYDLAEVDDKTINYLFNKVLKAPETQDSQEKSTDFKSSNNSVSKEQAKKPNTKPATPTNQEVTAEQLGQAWIKSLMTGTVTTTNNTANNGSPNNGSAPTALY